MKKFNTGFTLVELLIVITIIGSLLSIVLAAVNGARQKSHNATVKQNLAQFIRAAELYYENNNNSYQAMCADDQYRTASLYESATQNGKSGSVANRCNANATGYAVSIELKNPEGSFNFWCVDYFGKVKGHSSDIGAGTTQCP